MNISRKEWYFPTIILRYAGNNSTRLSSSRFNDAIFNKYVWKPSFENPWIWLGHRKGCGKWEKTNSGFDQSRSKRNRFHFRSHRIKQCCSSRLIEVLWDEEETFYNDTNCIFPLNLEEMWRFFYFRNINVSWIH